MESQIGNTNRKVHEIHLTFTITPKMALSVITAALITSTATQLGSETLTLTTTYPSPSGIYRSIVTTGGNPGAPVDTVLARNAGRVGIGTPNPTGTLTIFNPTPVLGTVSFWDANGDMSYDGGSDGIFYFKNYGIAAGRTSFLTPNNAERLTISNTNGNIGINNVNPQVALDVVGDEYLSGKLTMGGAYIKVNGAQGGCWMVNNPNAWCPGGTYATWVPGYYADDSDWHQDLGNIPAWKDPWGNVHSSIMVQGQDTLSGLQTVYTYGDDTQNTTINFYCCPT